MGQFGGFYPWSARVSTNQSTEPPRLVTKCHHQKPPRSKTLLMVSRSCADKRSAMHNPTVATRVYTSAIFAGLALLLGATTARAQYQPRPLNDPATGEKFIVEADASLWSPGAEISFESSGLGIVGSQIDAKRDLGVADERIPSLNVQLRPARSHHIRFQYVPIEFSGATRITRDLVFNGIRYQANVPVNSSLDWKSYRFGYQYDFIVKNQGFAGVIVEAKYTDVTARLATPLQQEFTRQRAPI